MRIKIASSFLWGAALSSYQAEGGNYNCDWYFWEKEKNLTPAGCAARHYQLYQSDFDIASQLNLNALRLSLEWSRLMPSPGVFSAAAFTHYGDVFKHLRRRGLKPIVTLQHFTNPLWFVSRGGWLNSRNIDYFLAYLKYSVEAFKGEVDYWLVFNEPLVYLFNGYVEGVWPPGEKSFARALRALRNMVAAYIAAYREIKRIYRENTVNVSFAKHLMAFAPCPRSPLNLSGLRRALFNMPLLSYLHKKKALDFIALNYYRKEYSRFQFFLGKECRCTRHAERQNYMGWNVYPRGLYELLCRLRDFSLPIIITENGSAEDDLFSYREYLSSHLGSMARAIASGIDVRGYFWWALTDNFEWDKGFGPRFGLAEVDYGNFTRKLRPFAYLYGKICKSNTLEF